MPVSSKLEISPPQSGSERDWLQRIWIDQWGGEVMVTRYKPYHFAVLKMLIARIQGKPAGAATYRFAEDSACELMSLNALSPGMGIGSGLLSAVEKQAASRGCRRIWTITSNDNLGALRFYQKRGYRIAAVYPGAIDQARTMKPTIPRIGNDGIEIHDEIELSKALLNK